MRKPKIGTTVFFWSGDPSGLGYYKGVVISQDFKLMFHRATVCVEVEGCPKGDYKHKEPQDLELSLKALVDKDIKRCKEAIRFNEDRIEKLKKLQEGG